MQCLNWVVGLDSVTLQTEGCSMTECVFVGSACEWCS